MIAVDLCQANYQTLSIIYLTFTAKSVEGVKKERKSSQYTILQDLKIINYTTSATNVKKDGGHLSADSLKSFQIRINFAIMILASLSF